GLFASNIFWPRGVKGGTLLPKPRSPHSRQVPPPPYPLELRLQIPARSFALNGRLSGAGAAACPPRPPRFWATITREKIKRATKATIRITKRFRMTISLLWGGRSRTAATAGYQLFAFIVRGFYKKTDNAAGFGRSKSDRDDGSRHQCFH